MNINISSGVHSPMAKATDRIYYNTQKISFSWKYYQSTLYLIGSTCFLIASLLYYPFFGKWIDNNLWGGVFFVIASSCLFFAEIREWRHHCIFACQMLDSCDQEQKFVFKERKRYNRYFFVYMCGNILYLLGCIICLPTFDRYRLGIQLFLSGFGLLVCIELHKLFMVLMEKESICVQIRADTVRAIMEISGAVGDWTYFIGTLLFEWSEVEFLGVTLLVWGVNLYVIGGVASCIYSIIYLKKLLELHRDRERSMITSEDTGKTESKEEFAEKLM